VVGAPGIEPRPVVLQTAVHTCYTKLPKMVPARRIKLLFSG